MRSGSLFLLLLLATAPAAAAEPPAGSSVQDDYQIGAGDLLQVDIFELEELSKTVRVGDDGTVTYPMLGPVRVAGLTRRGLEGMLARLLEAKYVRNPQVTVLIQEAQSAKVSVLGAVRTPGTYNLTGTRTLLDVIGQAGGLGGTASRAFLTRGSGSEPMVIDLKKLMEEGDLSQNLRLQPGDVVYVPVARPLKVFVYGQVERPGMLEAGEARSLTALQAISMAGGLSKRAAAGKTKIVRGEEGEKRQNIRIDLSRILAGKDPDPVLEDGDIIVVPKSFF